MLYFLQDIFIPQSIIMEIFIVLATTFFLGAVFSFYWVKAGYEKQLHKVKSAADKKLEDLWVDKTILEHRILLLEGTKIYKLSY